MRAARAALSGTFVSPIIGSLPPLQAPETRRGHVPSPWQGSRLRTLGGSRCARGISGLVPGVGGAGEPSGLGGCSVFRAKEGLNIEQSCLKAKYFNLSGLRKRLNLPFHCIHQSLF